MIPETLSTKYNTQLMAKNNYVNNRLIIRELGRHKEIPVNKRWGTLMMEIG